MLEIIVGEVVGGGRKVILGSYCTSYMQKIPFWRVAEGVSKPRLSTILVHGNLDLMYVTVTKNRLKLIGFAATMIWHLFITALLHIFKYNIFDYSHDGETLNFN